MTPTDRQSVDRAYVSGLAWTAAAKWFLQIVSWVSTLWVARLLSPDDYGIVGMAGVYLGLAFLLSEGGLGASIIRFRALTDTTLRQLNSISLLLGCLAAVISWLLAQPLANFFKTPDLSLVLWVLSFNFVASGLKIVPYSLLRRDLNYRYLALADGLSAIIATLSTLTLALTGAGYWALVGGQLVQAASLTILPILKRPIGFATPSYKSLAPPLAFGYRMIQQRVAWYLYSSADKIIIGRVLGQASLGAYSLATTLANLPVEKITSMTARVTSTVFAAVQDSPQEMGRYFLRTTEVLAVITMPIATGLALVAPDLVYGVLGPSWEPAAVPIQILALVSVVKTIHPLGAMVANLRGKEVVLSRLNIALLFIMPPSMWYATRWGIEGVAAVWLIVFPAFAIIFVWIGCKTLEISLRDYARLLEPAVTSTSIMAVTVMLFQEIANDARPLARLALAVGVGVLAYAATLLLFYRKRLREIARFAKRFRSASTAS
ncbi:MAG: lipopolysaccharide biosynthesis protein [Caldilineaceae bacterium]